VSPLQLDLARRLGAMIAGGEFAAGTHLSEPSLCGRFGVSRTPVRAALRLLARYRFVELRPGAGYAVAKGAQARRLPAPGKIGLTPEELYRNLVDARARRLLPDALSERGILARFPVPRSLLAKTLVTMVADGLIEKRRGHGWRFLPSLGTADAIAESYRFRLTIECAGLAQPTFRAEPERLRRARELHERFLALPEERQTVPEFLQLNAAFHEMLAQFSGNRFILQATQQQNQLRRLDEHAQIFRHRRMPESCREHLQIMDAIESGDQEWAAALMRHHLTVARNLSGREDG